MAGMPRPGRFASFERWMSARAWRAGFEWMHAYRMAPQPAPTLAGPLRIRAVDLGEALEMARDVRLEMREVHVREAYATGSVCLAAWDEQGCAGYAWLARRIAAHSPGRVVRVRPGVEYRYKVMVLPEARGRGVATTLYRHANAALREAGCVSAVLFVAPHNGPSVGAAFAAGGVRIGTVWVPGAAAIPALHSPAVREAGVTFVNGEVIERGRT